jgi:hydrogenase assembly chaperone HypC/HupF
MSEQEIEQQTSIITCHPDHCTTCSDEVQLGKVVSVEEKHRRALVDLEGLTQEIDITLIENVRRGDRLIVHGGVAIERVEGSEAGEGEQEHA